jgi:hypothetical protein
LRYVLSLYLKKELRTGYSGLKKHLCRWQRKMSLIHIYDNLLSETVEEECVWRESDGPKSHLEQPPDKTSVFMSYDFDQSSYFGFFHSKAWNRIWEQII